MKMVKKKAVDENLQNLLLIILVKSLSLQNEEEKLREAVDKCTKVRQVLYIYKTFFSLLLPSILSAW